MSTQISLIDVASLVAANPGLSASALAKVAGMRLTHRGSSMAWYARIREIAATGAIVERATGKVAYGNEVMGFYPG